MTETKTKSAITDLTSGPLGKQLLLYSLPLIGSNFMQAFYTLVDLWVVGNFASTADISAVSISGQIFQLMLGVGMGLGSGAQILISQQVGAKNYEKLGSTIGTMFSFGMITSLGIFALGVFGCDLWLSLMQTPSEAYSGARIYLLICCIGVIFSTMGGLSLATLRGIGNSRLPMYIMTLSTVINIILDFIFVAMLGMGAAGAALATIIAQFVSCSYAIIMIYRIRADLGFDFKPQSFRIKKAPLVIMLRLSAPLIVMNISVTLSMLVVTGLVNTAGLAASAITGIGSKVMSMISVITNSMSAAVGAMGAQNFAAGKLDRVRSLNRISNIFCLICCVICSVIFWFFPTQIIGFFTQATDVEVLALAPTYMHILILTEIASFLMATPMGHINAVGFTTLNLVSSLLDAVAGRIGLSVLLGGVLGYGVIGYWVGNGLAAYITVIISFAYYFFGHWENRKPLVERKEE